jgi:hypothetical protein
VGRCVLCGRGALSRGGTGGGEEGGQEGEEEDRRAGGQKK